MLPSSSACWRSVVTTPASDPQQPVQVERVRLTAYFADGRSLTWQTVKPRLVEVRNVTENEAKTKWGAQPFHDINYDLADAASPHTILPRSVRYGGVELRIHLGAPQIMDRTASPVDIPPDLARRVVAEIEEAGAFLVAGHFADLLPYLRRIAGPEEMQ